MNDLNSLAPNHFLFFRYLNIQETDQTNSYYFDSRQNWKVLGALSNISFKRFVKEYIPSLNSRKKMIKVERNSKMKNIF